MQLLKNAYPASQEVSSGARAFDHLQGLKSLYFKEFLRQHPPAVDPDVAKTRDSASPTNSSLRHFFGTIIAIKHLLLGHPSNSHSTCERR